MAGRLIVMVLSALVFVPAAAMAQNNFFNRGGVALYEPVVDVVNSGSRFVASPTVSADRKYVTISAQPQLSQLVALQNFPVAILGNANGNVGGVPGPAGQAGGQGDAGIPDANGGQAVAGAAGGAGEQSSADGDDANGRRGLTMHRPIQKQTPELDA